jgi:hypothetical protein
MGTYNDNENNDDYSDQLELCAETIIYKTADEEFLHTELRNFETWKIGQHEIGEDAIDDAEVLVSIDQEISGEKAISLLKKIIAEIEAHGLPSTKLVLPSKLAELVVKREAKSPAEAADLFRWLLSKTSDKAGDHHA